MTNIIDIFIDLFGSLFELVAEIFNIGNDYLLRRNHDLKASFQHPRNVMSKDNWGFAVGTYAISEKASFETLLVEGPSGSSKTSGVILPSIYNIISKTKSSLIIHDPSGEIAAATSRAADEFGFCPFIINWSDPAISCAFNPLKRAQTSQAIRMACHTLMSATLGDSANDSFWNLQGIETLSIFARLLKKMDSKYDNLANLRNLLLLFRGNETFIDSLFSQYADEKLFNEYKAAISFDDKLLSSIVANALASLSMLSDDSIAKITSFDSCDFLDYMRKEKCIVYITGNPAQQKYFAPLSSLFFAQLFEQLLSYIPNKNENSIYIILDECPTLRIESLPLFTAQCRKHRIGSLLCCQSRNQFILNYKIAGCETLETNAAIKVNFPGGNLDTTSRLEQVLGKYTYLDENNVKRTRNLLEKDEIRTIPKGKALVIFGTERPILMDVLPHYKNKKYIPLLEKGAYQFPKREYAEEVELIQSKKDYALRA